MELNINQPILNEHPTAKLIINFLQENAKEFDIENSFLYNHFPMYLDVDNVQRIADVLLIDKFHGILVFKCLDQTTRTLDSGEIKEIINDFEQTYSLLFSKLVRSRRLRKNPNSLFFNIKPILYIPDYENSDKINWEELAIVGSTTNLPNIIKKLKIDTINDSILKEIISIIEGSNNFIKIKERSFKNEKPNTKGKILEKIELEIKNFDIDQKKSALKIIDGPQRIRGLAGSGKTIVLTMKAAQIHLSQPDAKILYTYFTKQLYDYIKFLITRFYRDFAFTDPDWSKIDIIHAWGGKNLEGVYYNTCIQNGINPKTFACVIG